MAKLTWDQSGTREYETGIDHGVLYVADGSAVVWNGLTSIDEDFSGETSTPYYLDGVKYLDSQSNGDYAASLKAFTYPDEFMDYEGTAAVATGLYADDQPVSAFSLSYRTKIGTDLDENEGYRLHLVYNLTAVIDATTNSSLTDTPAPLEFSWNLQSIPESAPGYAPTAHVIIDSRYVYSYMLSQLEDILYGTDDVDASLPPLSELLTFVQGWHLIYIVDNGDGTWTATGPSSLISMLDATTFQIQGANVVYQDADTYTITTTNELQGG